MLEKIKAFIAEAQKYAKAIVATVGGLLLLAADLSQQFGVTVIPADWQPYINFGIVVLTAFATWRIPNAGFVADPYANGAGTLPRESGE